MKSRSSFGRPPRSWHAIRGQDDAARLVDPHGDPVVEAARKIGGSDVGHAEELDERFGICR